MATRKKAPRALTEVRASVRRLTKDGEHMVGRLQRDAKALVSRSRNEILKDVRAVRSELRTRADRAVRDLERKVIRQFHAATEEQVRRLERRLARLEQQVGALAARLTGGERAA
jgi:hypothetical protein